MLSLPPLDLVKPCLSHESTVSDSVTSLSTPSWGPSVYISLGLVPLTERVGLYGPWGGAHDLGTEWTPREPVWPTDWISPAPAGEAAVSLPCDWSQQHQPSLAPRAKTAPIPASDFLAWQSSQPAPGSPLDCKRSLPKELRRLPGGSRCNGTYRGPRAASQYRATCNYEKPQRAPRALVSGSLSGTDEGADQAPSL